MSLVQDVLALQAGDPRHLKNPYALFNRVREDEAVLDYGPALLVTRFEDVEKVFRDQHLFSSAVTDGPYFQDMYDRLSDEEKPMMRFMMDWERDSLGRADDPVHLKRRKPIQTAMTVRRIEGLKGSIERRADELIDRIAAAGGPVDFMDAFAFRLPILVVAELIGIPVDNYEQLRVWTQDWFAWKGNLAYIRRSYEGTKAFIDWLEILFAERRAMAERPDDLLNSMIFESGLDNTELQVNCLAIIAGGFETTTALLGSCLWHLHRHPDQLAWVREDLAERVPKVIDETLRFEPPLHSMGRVATTDTVLSGIPVAKGKSILNCIAAANRDPRIFADPDMFDATRDAGRIATFGVPRGAHFCPGSALAKLEAKIGLTKILERFPRIEILTDEPEWNDHYILRMMRSLPVRFHTAHA